MSDLMTIDVNQLAAALCRQQRQTELGSDWSVAKVAAFIRERATTLAASGELIYLASPYSHADTRIRDERFRIVCRVAARLMSEGRLIFSPIAHTHPIAMAGELPTGWDFWQKYDHAQLDAAAEMWVLRIDGWEQSKGVAGEIEYMRQCGKPVKFIDPIEADLAQPQERDDLRSALREAQQRALTPRELANVVEALRYMVSRNEPFMGIRDPMTLAEINALMARLRPSPTALQPAAAAEASEEATPELTRDPLWSLTWPRD